MGGTSDTSLRALGYSPWVQCWHRRGAIGPDRYGCLGIAAPACLSPQILAGVDVPRVLRASFKRRTLGMVLCCLLFNLDADPTNCVFVLTRGHLTSASEAAGISDYVKVIAQAGLMYEQAGGGRHCPGGSSSRTFRTSSGLRGGRPAGGSHQRRARSLPRACGEGCQEARFRRVFAPSTYLVYSPQPTSGPVLFLGWLDLHIIAHRAAAYPQIAGLAGHTAYHPKGRCVPPDGRASRVPPDCRACCCVPPDCWAER